MKQGLKKAFGSEIYIVFIFFLALLNWFQIIDYRICIPVLTATIVLIVFSCTSSDALIPIILSLLISNVFAYKSLSNDVEGVVNRLNFPLLITCAVIGVVSLIYFYFKNRRAYGKTSILGLSLVAIFVSFTLSDIFKSKSIDFINVGMVILLFYFFKHTIDYYQMKEKFLPYFSKTMFYFAITISIEIIAYYALNFTLDSPINFAPELGWSNHNGVSMLLLISIPVASYILFYTQNPGYFIGLLILFSANILTTSRGGIVSMAIMVPLIIINNYRKYHSRRDFFKGLFITILFFSVIGIAFSPYLSKILHMLFYDGLGDSGRFDLWRQAVEAFKNNPILGIGTNIMPKPGEPWYPWFHSTFFDTLGLLGLVGIAAFGFHFISKYICVFTNRSTYKWFVLPGFLASGFYGLIDVAYFSFPYLIIYVIILSTLEHSSGYMSYKRND